MLNLTNRDIDLFKVMSLGVATYKMIIDLFNKAYSHAISDPALLRRLSMLRSAGYIESRKECYRKRSGHFTIYALTKTGAQAFAELGNSVESIRPGLPETDFLRHELNVTAVLHVIHIESSEGHYRYNFIDSSILKKYREKYSKDSIPDLQMTLRLKNRNIELNLEVDLGPVLIPKMVGRIGDQTKTDRLILILCNSEARIQTLRTACYYAGFDNKDRLFFAGLGDFIKFGFLQTKLRSVDNQIAHLRLDDE